MRQSDTELVFIKHDRVPIFTSPPNQTSPSSTLLCHPLELRPLRLDIRPSPSPSQPREFYSVAVEFPLPPNIEFRSAMTLHSAGQIQTRLHVAGPDNSQRQQPLTRLSASTIASGPMSRSVNISQFTGGNSADYNKQELRARLSLRCRQFTS